MFGGEFDPSAAVREINRALQTARHSRPALNWDEITRAICGLYTSLPVDSAYIGGKLDLFTMAYAGTIPHELSISGTGIDLRNTQRPLAIERYAERYAERSAAAKPGSSEESPGSLALAPRRSETARRGQFGLVYQVEGGESTVDSYHDELTRFGGSGDAETDFMDHLGFCGASPLGDSAWGYFPLNDVLAARSRGMS